jgi:hypothetical protein
MTRADIGIAVALSLALTACSPAGTSGPSATPPASQGAAAASPPQTEAPTQGPPASQATPPEVCPDGPQDCQVPAGTYHAANFDGGITFRLHGDVWTAVAYTPEILSFQITTDWAVFMSGEIRLRSGDEIKMTTEPATARRFLSKLPGIEVTPVDETVVIDGAEALVFDVSNTGTDTTQLWGMGNTSGIYSLDPGVSVRMHWLDRDGTPFILALESPDVSFPAFIEDSTVIIESIVFD